MLDQKMNAEIVVPEKRVPYQIGETFGSRELIGSYVNPGMLDAQFDFNLYWDAKTAIGAENPGHSVISTTAFIRRSAISATTT